MMRNAAWPILRLAPAEPARTGKTRLQARRNPARVSMAMILALCLTYGPTCSVAQDSQAAGQSAPHALFINILEGDGALNNIRQRDAREPVIQVTDENHRPVAGAAIVFLIHGGKNGAGAAFPGGAQTLTVTTAADGTAHAAGLQLASAPGSFTVSVSASLSGLLATAVIHQANIIGALTTTSASGSTAGSTAGSTGGGSVGSTAGNIGSIAKHGILHASKGALIGTTVAVATVVGIVAVTKASSATSLTAGASRIGP